MKSGWEQEWTGNGSKAGLVVTTYYVPAEYGVSASYPQLVCH